MQVVVLFVFVVDSLAFLAVCSTVRSTRDKRLKNPDFPWSGLQSVLRMMLVALGTIGTISARKRADGSTAYTAQIRLKEQGVIVHTDMQTFTKKALAQA